MTRQAVGDILLDFSLPVLGGGERSLDASLAGKRGAVGVFWSGVCSHCQRYDAYLSDFGDRHQELALLVVASRKGESAGDLSRTVAERALAFEILHDAERRVTREWLVEQTPRAFFLDGERRLLYRGAIDNFKLPSDAELLPYLESAISDFLAGREVKRSETASFGCPVESVYYDLPKP